MKEIQYRGSRYFVRDDGKIFRHGNNKIKEVNPYIGGAGNLYINMYVNGIKEGHCLSTFIAKLFVPNPNNYRYVNHIDGNLSNNSASNLEWIPHPSKCFGRNHIIKCEVYQKSSGNMCDEIRYFSLNEAARDLGVSVSKIRHRIVSGSELELDKDLYCYLFDLGTQEGWTKI